MKIKRIVKLTFKQEKVDEFLTTFEQNKKTIRSFEGCQHLELHQDAHQSNVFFTLSIWDDETFLDAYRNSPFFKETWKNVKPNFDAKPEAYSLVEKGRA